MARHFVRANSTTLWLNNPLVTGLPFTFAGWWYPTAFVLGEFYNLAGLTAATGTPAYVILGAYQDDARPGIWSIRNQTAGLPAVGSWPLNTGALTLNTWNHCAFTSTQTLLCSYINGGTKTAQAVSFNQFAGELTQTSFGGYITTLSGGTFAHYINGRLAEWGVWNVALTDEEVAALGKGVSPLMIRPSALVAYYPLFGTDSPEPDRWRDARSLTLLNAPTKADHVGLVMPFRQTTGGLANPAAALQAAASLSFGATATLTPPLTLASSASMAFSASANLTSFNAWQHYMDASRNALVSTLGGM